ncbi:tRNA pseudouridine(55) synthase TruB [Aequoribacter sp.]|uniref:tRNA pseudouridine(55) synthase TruB n=1 Tax=Aequoribacter sp. TaxID=2847771 RepID=UPI003F69F70F
MARRKRGCRIDGILILDKPQGYSSNGALQQCRRALDAQKAGHTGALDPLATGVLPVCFGEATKFSQYLLDAEKAYLATICFGETRTTGDAEGEVVETSNASHLTAESVEQAMQGFKGAIKQVPPMYSALKKDGQPLYKLARQGIEIEREARDVVIEAFDMLDFIPDERAFCQVFVRCSKGTYIRSLAEDLGASLGVGAHLTALRRTEAGPFDLSDAMTLEQVQSAGQDLVARLLPIDAGLQYLTRLTLGEQEIEKLLQGQRVNVLNDANSGIVRVARASGEFVGLAKASEDGEIAPLRMIATHEG